MLRQGLQVGFGLHRIHARITTFTRLYNLDTRKKLCWNLHATAVTPVPAAAAERSEELVLHRLDEPAIHWRHLPRHANVHVVVIRMHKRFRRSRFGLRNHRFRGGLVRTSSRGGKRRGHSSCLASGMLIVTVCGLLRLYGGLAVALAIYAFPRGTLLALGAVPLLVTLIATH